jgi:hypothetical protein
MWPSLVYSELLCGASIAGGAIPKRSLGCQRENDLGIG